MKALIDVKLVKNYESIILNTNIKEDIRNGLIDIINSNPYIYGENNNAELK